MVIVALPQSKPNRLNLIKRRHLERYIDTIAKRNISPIVDEIVASTRDQISDENKANGAEFREQVEDGNSEKKGIEIEMFLKEKIAKSKYWFNASSQSLPDSKSSPSYELGSIARHGSI
ncbi:hypothetical protein BDV24DRAFT_170465 [Aspergillus arachidicola]|uniref:Uncharacterized protein n=1 Tax=Aspergillus arachidicola TaxID=656916 RepID=A0A5N6XPX7_9EURO|nr:hypothetical protein BDV24DRAFT_170465 [Aspergillus arachidicola]